MLKFKVEVLSFPYYSDVEMHINKRVKGGYTLHTVNQVDDKFVFYWTKPENSVDDIEVM